MCYDYAGAAFSTHTSHSSNLYPSPTNPHSTPFSTVAAVKYYTSPSHGAVAPSKLVLGMPLYGRAFGCTNGLGCAFQGHGGEGDDGVGGSWEAGVWDYKALPRAGAVEEVDIDIDGGEGVGASWSFDEGKRVLVSFDNVDVACAKSRFIKRWGLGGGMWWESSGDRSVGEEGSLIATVWFAFSFSLGFEWRCHWELVMVVMVVVAREKEREREADVFGNL